MASKQMKYESDARMEIANGLSQLARAVKATLGPRGTGWLDRSATTSNSSSSVVVRITPA